MERKFAKLQQIDHDERITREGHDAFLHLLQSALLLSLRERGWLNTMQHRHAEERLNRQRRERAKMLLQQEEHP